jgi:hypothetical protein
MAKYKLLIKKECCRKAIWVKENRKPFSFSVVDLDKGSFPVNWVCNLPKNKACLVNKSDFSKIFTKNSLKMAIDLLTVARKEYSDLDIQQEIDLRLSMIQPQVINFDLIFGRAGKSGVGGRLIWEKILCYIG